MLTLGQKNGAHSSSTGHSTPGEDAEISSALTPPEQTSKTGRETERERCSSQHSNVASNKSEGRGCGKISSSPPAEFSLWMSHQPRFPPRHFPFTHALRRSAGGKCLRLLAKPQGSIWIGAEMRIMEPKRHRRATVV